NGGRRDSRSQSLYGTFSRRQDAAHFSPALTVRAADSARSPLLRIGSLCFGNYLSGTDAKHTNQPSGPFSSARLSTALYTTQAPYSSLHVYRRVSRRSADSNGLVRRAKRSYSESVASLCNPFFLAVSPFSGNSMDIS